MASPFSVFRKYQYIALVTVGVLAIVSFVVLPPINDYLMSTRRAGGPESHEVVLTWTGGKVRQSEMQAMQNNHILATNFVQAVIEETRKKQGQPSDPYGLQNRDPSEQAVVQRMILAEKADRLGVVISDEAIERYIYQLSDNMLEPAELNEILQASTGGRLTRRMLFSQLRREMLATSMRQMAFSGLTASPPAAYWQGFKKLREMVILEMVPLPVENFVDQLKQQPTSDDVRRLYEKYKDDYRNPNTPEPGFRRPDQVDFGYFRIDFDQFLDQAKTEITEEQVRAEYEQGLTRGDYKRPARPANTPAATPPTDTPPAESPAGESPDGEAPAEDAAPQDAADEAAPSEPSPTEDAPAEPPAEDAAPQDPPGDSPDGEQQPEDAPAVSDETLEAGDEADGTDAAGCDTQPPADPEPETSDAPAEPAEATEPAVAEESASSPPASDDATPAAGAPAETPADAGQAAAEPDDSPADAAAPDTAVPAIPENKTLEEVREDIVLKLARPVAQQRVDKLKTELRTLLETYYQQFTLWQRQSELPGVEPPPKPAPLNYQQLAEQYAIQYQTTGLVDPFEAEKTELGATSRFDNQTFSIQPFVRVAFDPDVQLFRPREIENRDGANLEYMYWKREQKDAFTPELAEIRVEVEDAWKKIEARKLAEKQAQELAKKASSANTNLREALPEYAEKVQETNQFSWLIMGNSLSLFQPQQPQLSTVEGVDGVTWDFMEKVFALNEGQVGVVTNAAETVYYVVRVLGRTPSENVLRERFLREFPSGIDQVNALLQDEYLEYYREWYGELEREMKVNWARVPDQVPSAT